MSERKTRAHGESYFGERQGYALTCLLSSSFLSHSLPPWQTFLVKQQASVLACNDIMDDAGKHSYLPHVVPPQPKRQRFVMAYLPKHVARGDSTCDASCHRPRSTTSLPFSNPPQGPLLPPQPASTCTDVKFEELSIPPLSVLRAALAKGCHSRYTAPSRVVILFPPA